MAANINPQATAEIVGRTVPLAFAFALSLGGVLLVAYRFVRLTQRYTHAGSVYGLVGLTLGPRAGVLADWALLGTYVPVRRRGRHGGGHRRRVAAALA
jgi:amino acid transporter